MLHVVIMGVAGSGKTTLARALQDQLGWPYAEADDFHSAQSRAKMTAGQALDDDDRLPWLHALRDWMAEQAAGPGLGTLITCSALKRAYRDVLREAPGRVHFLHVTTEPTVLLERLAARVDHFMPVDLAPSQQAALELLAQGEDGTVLQNRGTVAELVAQAQEVIAALRPGL